MSATARYRPETRRLGPAIVAVVLILAACALAPAQGGPYPAGCESLGFEPRRCELAVERAIAFASVNRRDVVAIELLPPEDRVTLGGRMIARVRFRMADETVRDGEVWCTGIGAEDDRLCADDPRIGITGGVNRDVPCLGEAPEGCATEPPPPRPESVAAARPLELDAVRIPLDRLGHFEVKIGDASLPDGMLSERSAELADPRPTAYWLDNARLDVRPTEPGRPEIGSIYREPYDGPEPVEVFLVFEVVETSPGAVLEVRDMVVR